MAKARALQGRCARQPDRRARAANATPAQDSSTLSAPYPIDPSVRSRRLSSSPHHARGITDLGVLANLLPGGGFPFGAKPTSTDAGIYGFTANIYFYDIDTPLKEFLASQPDIVAHCLSVHVALRAAPSRR